MDTMNREAKIEIKAQLASAAYNMIRETKLYKQLANDQWDALAETLAGVMMEVGENMLEKMEREAA